MLGRHRSVKPCRRVELIPAQDVRQPLVGDAVFQAVAGLAIADDNRSHDAGRRFLPGHLKRCLAGASGPILTFASLLSRHLCEC
jgi:hypothetical protein